MRVVLEMFEPTLHWVALARVIENNPDLPNDVSLLVKKDRMAFVDSNGNEMAVLALEDRFSDERVRDVNGKLAVLEWIHECFPGHHQLGVPKVQPPAIAPTIVNGSSPATTAAGSGVSTGS